MAILEAKLRFTQSGTDEYTVGPEPRRSPITVTFSMKQTAVFSLTALLLAPFFALQAADIELAETNQLPACHSIGWVRANTQAKDQKTWNGILDEAKWGTPSPQQAIARNWDWKLTDAQWLDAVKQKGEGKPQRDRYFEYYGQ